jgi:hypothetical protein
VWVKSQLAQQLNDIVSFESMIMELGKDILYLVNQQSQFMHAGQAEMVQMAYTVNAFQYDWLSLLQTPLQDSLDVGEI